MRIGLVCLHTSPLADPGRGDAGGMNVVVRALGDALAASGHDVELVTRAGVDAPADPLVELPSGARVRFLPAGSPGLAKEQLPAVLDEFGARLAELPRFEVLHAHYWLSGIAALPVARAQGIPLLMSFHTLGSVKNTYFSHDDAREPPVRLEAEARLAAEADGVIVATRFEAEAIGRVDAAVIPPGVDTALFHPGGEPVRPPYLVVAGRIQPLKGQLLAIEAIAALPGPARPRLYLVGEASGRLGDAYLARLRAAAAGLDVVFTGALPRTGLAALLRGATALLAPSTAESFGLVALEAAASGAPVIAGRVPGLSDSVVDGVTGVLLPGRDAGLWADAIGRMLGDPATRAAMAQASVAHARGFGWANVASQTANFYAAVGARP